MTQQELVELLDKYHVSHQEWGTGNAKTLEHLLKEVNGGEAKLEVEEGQLVRRLRVSVIDVYYQEGETKQHLVEDRQEFKEGRVRRRSLRHSIYEKLVEDEDPTQGANRALQEELGITGEGELKDLGERSEPEESASYPGLPARYKQYHYNYQMPESEYKPEGYIEVQPDKTTYFIWVASVEG